ncbi:hypothetical protein Csa_023595, partial [Cucumis sativus]
LRARPTCSRLDRFLYSKDWDSTFNHHYSKTLTRTISYHYPIILKSNQLH